MVWTPTAKAKANAKVSKLKTNSKDKTAGPRARTDRQASNRKKPGLNKKAHRQSGRHKSASPSFLSTKPLTLNPKQSYLLFMWARKDNFTHACMHVVDTRMRVSCSISPGGVRISADVLVMAVELQKLREQLRNAQCANKLLEQKNTAATAEINLLRACNNVLRNASHE